MKNKLGIEQRTFVLLLIERLYFFGTPSETKLESDVGKRHMNIET